MAKVSVIIPVYKAEKYLERCVNSLKNQTLKDIEIIDNDEDGDACGTIISIVYKGDHYQVIIRTDEEEEDFVADTEYVWNENDRVSVKIPKDKIKLKLKVVNQK